MYGGPTGLIRKGGSAASDVYKGRPYVDMVDLRDLKVLIADDVADTGHTLALVREHCLSEVADVRSAVLYQKPQSVVDCEYVWKHTDKWINFPWSTETPLVNPRKGSVVLDA